MLIAITVVVAAVVVLAAIVVVAMGRGGELSVAHPDHPRLGLPNTGQPAGTDVALLRLPIGLVGYHKQITDEAMQRFAEALTERDTRIAVLERRLADVLDGQAARPSSRPGGTSALEPGEPVAASSEPASTAAGTVFDMPRAVSDELWLDESSGVRDETYEDSADRDEPREPVDEAPGDALDDKPRDGVPDTGTGEVRDR